MEEKWIETDQPELQKRIFLAVASLLSSTFWFLRFGMKGKKMEEKWIEMDRPKLWKHIFLTVTSWKNEENRLFCLSELLEPSTVTVMRHCFYILGIEPVAKQNVRVGSANRSPICSLSLLLPEMLPSLLNSSEVRR
ncbi:hypothetical protein JHK86_004666 [Glycine max]|nr:hypothetical protein JHK86_004666 [Glycine max]